jgi:hypothetical protein
VEVEFALDAGDWGREPGTMPPCLYILQVRPQATLVADVAVVEAGEHLFVSLDDLNDLVDIELPSQDADTLGGFIYEFLGKVPAANETIQTEHLRLEVLSVQENRIGKVRVRLLSAPADQSPQKNGTTHATTQDRD